MTPPAIAESCSLTFSQSAWLCQRNVEAALHDQRTAILPSGYRTSNSGGARASARSTQSVENWTSDSPCQVVAPSSPVDVIGLMAAAVRDPDVIFHEHKSLYATKGVRTA